MRLQIALLNLQRATQQTLRLHVVPNARIAGLTARSIDTITDSLRRRGAALVVQYEHA
jgi:hypothetical protein